MFWGFITITKISACIYPPPKNVTQSIFMQSTAGLNSDFSFLVALTTLKNPVVILFTFSWVHPFLKVIHTRWSFYSLVQDLNLACQFHFLWLKFLYIWSRYHTLVESLYCYKFYNSMWYKNLLLISTLLKDNSKLYTVSGLLACCIRNLHYCLYCSFMLVLN